MSSAIRAYVARGSHKRPCDLCGTPVLPGDRMVQWCWVAEEPSGSNIIRVHETCHALQAEIGFEEFELGNAFDRAGPGESPTDTTEQDRAMMALARARALVPPGPDLLCGIRLGLKVAAAEADRSGQNCACKQRIASLSPEAIAKEAVA